MSGTATGLRERKKHQTRELIAETALRLFLERGFAAVTVAHIAQVADVSEKTVFNYFPAKEDLVFRRLELFEDGLADAIRGRPTGESVSAAFARFVAEPRGLLADRAPETRERLRAVNRMIAGSPVLRDREQQVFARYTDSLAVLIAEETAAGPDSIEPWVVANALMGVHRALVAHVRRRSLDGASATRIAREVRRQAAQAIARLDEGLEPR
jgi:AcrR family transcriptional regulator